MEDKRKKDLVIEEIETAAAEEQNITIRKRPIGFVATDILG